MSDWHDNLVAFRIAYRLGRIEARQQEILDLLKGRSTTSSWAVEFGRTLLRALVPYLTPYVWAVLTGFGALSVGLFKAFTRGWL